MGVWRALYFKHNTDVDIDMDSHSVCVTMNCACKSFPALVAVRVLLGCFESAVAPALILITGMWASITIYQSELI